VKVVRYIGKINLWKTSALRSESQSPHSSPAKERRDRMGHPSSVDGALRRRELFLPWKSKLVFL
jgi:hypothetical protein